MLEQVQKEAYERLSSIDSSLQHIDAAERESFAPGGPTQQRSFSAGNYSPSDSGSDVSALDSEGFSKPRARAYLDARPIDSRLSPSPPTLPLAPLQDDGGMALTTASAAGRGSDLWSDFQNTKKQREMEKEAEEARKREQEERLRQEEARARERALAEQKAAQRERERQRAAERAAREQEDADFDLMGQSSVMASFEQNGVLG